MRFNIFIALGQSCSKALFASDAQNGMALPFGNHGQGNAKRKRHSHRYCVTPNNAAGLSLDKHVGPSGA